MEGKRRQRRPDQSNVSSSSSVQTKSPVIDNGVFDSAYCPICIEPYDDMEWRFYPCPCNYRLCSMCLHQIRIADGKCPQCREGYCEAKFRVLSEAEVGPLKRQAVTMPPFKTSHFAKENVRQNQRAYPGKSIPAFHRKQTSPPVYQAKPTVSELPKDIPKPPTAAIPVAATTASSVPRMQRFSGGMGVWD